MVSQIVSSKNCNGKFIKVQGYEVKTLVHTGAYYNLIREDMFRKLED